MEEAMEKCPRFFKCSVNKCPLDSEIDLRNELEEEEKCNMEKTVRLRIGKKFNLEKLGLTSREYAGYKKWQSKSEAEKSEIRNQLAKNGFGKQV